MYIQAPGSGMRRVVYDPAHRHPELAQENLL